MKTIAVDFDGVIHKYSKGWMDGSIYDEPIENTFEVIKQMMDNGYSVFVFTARNPAQIKAWLEPLISETREDPDDNWAEYKANIFGFTTEIIPRWKWWVKFWNKPRILGITNIKLPATVYIDDRGYTFKDWKDIATKLELK
jgi:hypothetical protein